MEQELFNPQSSSVTSSRILYTPSTFARTSLLHLQEVGSLQAIHPHTSTRTNLILFLCFVVLSGNGTLTYEGTTYELSAGDCATLGSDRASSEGYIVRWVEAPSNKLLTTVFEASLESVAVTLQAKRRQHALGSDPIKKK